MQAGKRLARKAVEKTISTPFPPLFTWGICAFLIVTLLRMPEAFGEAGSPKASSKSVVRITAKNPKGESIGTGFVWSKSTYVVTALHVVAGSDSIQVFSQDKGKGSSAKIIRVHRDSDLALLELDRDDLKLAPLKYLPVPPIPLEGNYSIWGYPDAVPIILGIRVSISESLKEESTLGDLFGTKAKYNKIVGTGGSPSFTAKILHIDSTIRHGQSGAPIFDKDGLVVGIADGGLHEGVASINWAISALAYLKELAISEEPKPKPGEIFGQAAHFSARVGKDVEVPIGPSKSEPSAHQKKEPEVAEKKPTSEASAEASAAEEGLKLYLSWSAPLSEILTTANDEDVEDAEKLDKKTTSDLTQAMIDVYEEYKTGATIAVPQGLSLFYDPEEGMLKARSPSGRVEMLVHIAKNETWKAGEKARDNFDRVIKAKAKWQPDPKEQDEHRKSKAYWSLTKSRIVPDKKGNPISAMAEALIIHNNNFLGTAVIASDMADLSKEDQAMLYKMIVCIDLASFSIGDGTIEDGTTGDETTGDGTTGDGTTGDGTTGDGTTGDGTTGDGTTGDGTTGDGTTGDGTTGDRTTE